MTRSAILRRRFFWVLKHTLNRLTSRVARSGRGPFAVICHVGRKTGRTYETPVILAMVPQGFVAELTYGDKVDWYRNIVAAGGCVVVYRGHQYRVNRIEPCTAEQGRNAYPARFRQVLAAARWKIVPPSPYRQLADGRLTPGSHSSRARSTVPGLRYWLRELP